MSDLFTITRDYREEFIAALKHNRHHYESVLSKYTTPSNKYNIEYYKWNHPYQGNWEYKEIFDDTILDYLQTLISPQSIVIDIGAQIGLMSVGFSLFAEKVISFEPNPAAYEVLENNSKVNKNIIPYNLACSNVEEVLQFHYSDNGLCNGGYALGCEAGVGVTGHKIPIDVYAVNIVDFLKTYHSDDIKNISLIKIDAEGHDKEILKTLKSLFNDIHPIIITEMYAGLRPTEITDLIDTLHNLSYDIYDIGTANEGLDKSKELKKINSISDLKVGSHGNLICFYKKA